MQVAKAVLNRVKATEAQVEAEDDGDADEALGIVGAFRLCSCDNSVGTGHPKVAVGRSIL